MSDTPTPCWRRQSSVDPLRDQHSLVFGERAKQVEQERTVRIRRVDSFRQRAEGDPAHLQILNDSDQVGE